ncbi:MAG: PD-(D/E)XK nuclease superfamily protein [Anaerolineae bacterium]
MNPRKTTTGAVLEQMVLPALEHGNYTYEKQVVVGQRLGGGAHKADIVATNAQGEKIIISLKWQQVSGTAEQKVPYEIMCLAEAIRTGEYSRAYVVLGGRGWSKRDYFTSGKWQEYIRNVETVRVVTLEDFVSLANQGKL